MTTTKRVESLTRADDAAQEVRAVVKRVTSTSKRIPISGGDDASKGEYLKDKGVYVIHHCAKDTFVAGTAMIHVLEPMAGVKVSIGTESTPDLIFKDADVGTKGPTIKSPDTALQPYLDGPIVMTVSGTVDPEKAGAFRVVIPLASDNVNVLWG